MKMTTKTKTSQISMLARMSKICKVKIEIFCRNRNITVITMTLIGRMKKRIRLSIVRAKNKVQKLKQESDKIPYLVAEIKVWNMTRSA